MGVSPCSSQIHSFLEVKSVSWWPSLKGIINWELQAEETGISNATQKSWIESSFGSFGEAQHQVKCGERSVPPLLQVEPPAIGLE